MEWKVDWELVFECYGLNFFVIVNFGDKGSFVVYLVKCVEVLIVFIDDIFMNFDVVK